MEKDEKKSEVVEEKVSEATEEIATPTPYKHPNRNLMDKEIETTATEESKEESDEKAGRPEAEARRGGEGAEERLGDPGPREQRRRRERRR